MWTQLGVNKFCQQYGTQLGTKNTSGIPEVFSGKYKS